MSTTNDPQAAAQAVADAQAAITDIYNKAMIKYGGDETSANIVVAQMTPNVLKLASLLPLVRTADAATAGPALAEALGLASSTFGVTDQKALYPWIRENVTDDNVLKAAGLDPVVVRRVPDTLWGTADLDALLAFARDMLNNWVDPKTGTKLSSEQIDAQLEAYRAAARKYGVGATRTAPSMLAPPPPPAGATGAAGTTATTATTAPNPAPADPNAPGTGTPAPISVADLAFARRV